MNIVNCALLGALVLSMPERPDVERLTDSYEYPGGSGYEGRFTRCGICTLMQELGSYDLTLALCHPDYTMSETGGATSFVRTYTLASGGPYCVTAAIKMREKSAPRLSWCPCCPGP